DVPAPPRIHPLSLHVALPISILLFGTDEQKQRFLPRCARGAISAFALTEPAVGSDPARLQTRAALAPEGDRWILDGGKLWCTNRSEEHTSELQSRERLVCRLL